MASPMARAAARARGVPERDARPYAANAALSGGGRVNAVLRTDDGVVSVQGWCGDLVRIRRRRAIERRRRSSAAHRTSSGCRGRTSRAFRARGPVSSAPSPSGCSSRQASSRTAVVVVDGREVASCRFPLRRPHLTCTCTRTRRWSVAPTSTRSVHRIGLSRRRCWTSHVAFRRRCWTSGAAPGALVAALRREGIEAFGLEIDDARIRHHLLDEVRPYVTLDDGARPSPPSRTAGSRACPAARCSSTFPGPMRRSPRWRGSPRGRSSGHRARHVRDPARVPPRGRPVAPAGVDARQLLHPGQPAGRARAARVPGIEMSRLGLVQCDRRQFYSSLAAVAQIAPLIAGRHGPARSIVRRATPITPAIVGVWYDRVRKFLRLPPLLHAGRLTGAHVHAFCRTRVAGFLLVMMAVTAAAGAQSQC